MKLVKINEAVSMYIKPVLKGKAEQRVMALAVDKAQKPFIGLAREITKSKGSVDVPGFVDESKLIVVESADALNWKKKKDLEIKNIGEIIRELEGDDRYFIGLEDPDIWADENGKKHVYFTIAFKYKEKEGYGVYLGHAEGSSIEKLVASKPVLAPVGKFRGFKEAAVSLVKKNNCWMNLTEALLVENGDELSVIVSAKAANISKPWEYKEVVLNPKKIKIPLGFLTLQLGKGNKTQLKEIKYEWCKGDASPCCFFPKDFLDRGDLLVGIINGREQKKVVNGKRVYGKFRPGLILFNPKTGKIPWISPEPLFEDPDARTITFASDFLRTGKKEGILYAHINDSFIRAYKIDGRELEKYVPQN